MNELKAIFEELGFAMKDVRLPEGAIVYSLARTYSLVTRKLAKVYKRFGLSVASFNLLVLLQRGKDVLFALLFGDASTNTNLARVQQELLTIAVPRAKAGALDFMRASTELAAAGTWQDPDSVSSDERADNVLMEVQYGEIESELVGQGIVLALSLINNLEVNEQVLYARMINIEDTTLIV